LPSVGLGRSSNGFSTGLDLLRAVTYSRAQLLEGRPLEPSAMLPGTNWDGQHVDQPTDEIDRDSSSDSTATLEVVGGHSGGEGFAFERTLRPTTAPAESNQQPRTRHRRRRTEKSSRRSSLWTMR